MSTRKYLPWKTWKQYAKLTSLKKFKRHKSSNGSGWNSEKRRKRENNSSNERRLLQTGESREGKSRANVLRLKENFTREWGYNDEKMVELLSRLAVKVRFITKFSKIFRFPKIFSNFFPKYLWIFFLNLGEIRKRKFLSAS